MTAPTAKVELEVLLVTTPATSLSTTAKELIEYVFLIEPSRIPALLLPLKPLLSMLIINLLFLRVG